MFNIEEFFKKENVLDYGFIELIDGMVKDPKLKIANSARVSFNKEATEVSDKDIKLIKYLIEHGHYSTLRHSYFTFRIKAPLLVFRQWWKYQIGSDWIEGESGVISLPETNWNELSGRYVELSDEFYIPEVLRIQSKVNKQGSFGKLEKLENGEDPVEFFRKSCQQSYDNYKYLVKSGAAKEQCRGILTQNIYSQCIWTVSLQAVLFFLKQRLKDDAQEEIRLYAQAVLNLIQPMFKDLPIKEII